ncbi:lactonase family protein [Pedobacter frigiditerrae]|uniref:Lactonase family protein n=1 Tax=Pedobacter frigiditerrae TaxID=2530452 RepID=A0A4R0N3N9_9SPHI|nr:lactonase family protein [Pedobacter frigiditerrae]TCC94395.1 lactonase family protein [Pedobacter frigiditerrae]
MKKTLFLVCALSLTFQANAQNYNLIIGTYTNKGNSEGIYVYDYNPLTAEAKLKSTTKTVNPSYLAISENKKFIYSVNEDGKNSSVSAFSFNAQSGTMSLLNKKSSEGADPCFITVDDKNVIIANYSGGNIAVFGRNADGSLTDLKQNIQHKGKSIDPKRQTSAHVHQVLFTIDKKHLISNDLGEDLTYIYKYNATSTTPLSTPKAFKTNPGSGPRHLAFTPNGKIAYLAHEFTGSISTFSYAKGNFNKLQEIGTIAKDFKGKIDGADIHVSPDGKFLYETNRGDANEISLFAIATDGTLTFIETASTLGKGPRNFSIDPTGNFLLVAHQYTNDVVIFKRDKTTGKLTDSGKRINVGTPVCLLFSK